MKRTKFFSIFAVALAAIGLFACNKSEVVSNTDSSVRSKAPISKNIRYFDSYEELSAEIDKVNAMSFEDLCDYEASIGFNSFGKLADMAYEEVAQYQDDYKDIDDVITAMAQYSDYLQLIQDENKEYSLETKLYERAAKYIVNEEKMYQVKDTLIMVLDNVMLEAHADYYDTLCYILKIFEGSGGINFPFELVNKNKIFVMTFHTCPCCHRPNCRGCCPRPPSQPYIGPYKEAECLVEKIQDGKYKRDHKLIVRVQMEPIGGDKVQPLYMFKTRRKCIGNVCWYGYDNDVTFDLTMTHGIAVSGYTFVPDPRVFKRSGTVRTDGYRHDYTGNFLWGNVPPSYYFEYGNSVQTVFATTNGWAECSAHGVVMHVPFDF